MGDTKPGSSENKKVLVVDDNDLILRLVDRQLRSAGFDVVTAPSGEAAVDWCEENGRPDILLTDVSMPGLDGPALYQRLQRRYPDVPVLFMSATAGNEKGRTIAPLLRKPFRREQLTSMINAFLQSEPPEPTAD